MTIQQRQREREFDQVMHSVVETVAYGVAPNLAKALAGLSAVEAALAGDYADMQSRYAESIAPIIERMPVIAQKAAELLAEIQAADRDVVASEDMGMVYPSGLFLAYQVTDDEANE